MGEREGVQSKLRAAGLSVRGRHEVLRGTDPGIVLGRFHAVAALGFFFAMTGWMVVGFWAIG